MIRCWPKRIAQFDFRVHGQYSRQSSCQHAPEWAGWSLVCSYSSSHTSGIYPPGQIETDGQRWFKRDARCPLLQSKSNIPMWQNNVQHLLAAAHIFPTLSGRCCREKHQVRIRFSITSFYIIPDSFLLVVEFVEVLHVSEDDVLLVDDPWWDLLNATGHLPQIRLHREKLAKQRLINGGSFLPLCQVTTTPTLTSMHSLRSRTYAFSVWISSAMMNLETHTEHRKIRHIYWFYTSWNYSNFRILSDTGVKAYSFLRADLRFSSFNSWAASRSLTSDPGAVAGMMSNWRSLLCKRKV